MGSDTKGPTPRAPRLSLSVPVVLQSSEGRVKGHSIDVSESGILVRFEQPVDYWMEGRLMAMFGESYVIINVRAMRIEGRQTGLAFLIANDDDRASVTKLLEHAQTPLRLPA
jgi:hypothetical protein